MPLFLIIVIGILIAGFVLFVPMAGLVLVIYSISLLRFPTLFPSFIGIFTQLSAVKLIGGLTFCSVIVHNLVGKKKIGVLQSKQAKFFLFYLVWVAISGFSQPCSFTRESFTRYVSLVMFFYITISLIDTPERFRLILWSCIISMFGASSFALFQHINAEEVIRARSVFLDSNYFNFYLLPMIPVAFYRFLDERLLFKKIIAGTATFILILAVIFTFSRGGMVGLAVVLLLLALNSQKKLKAFLMVGIFITLFTVYTPNYFRERIEKTELELNVKDPNTSTYRRLLLSKAGLRMLLDKPLTGVGVGNFFWAVNKYAPVYPGYAHNMYMEVAAELGLPGIFLFMGIIFFTLRDLRMIIKKASPSLKSYAQGFYVGLMGFLASAVFLHAEYEKFLWLFIFLTICLKKLVVQKEGITI
ncbi:MAG: O-antigen ligase family protein [Candidatus Omnitrophota bacterium]